MVSELRDLIGPAGGDAIGMLIRSLRTPRADLGTMIIGAAGLLFVASGLFNHLRDSLNTIWEVTARPKACCAPPRSKPWPNSRISARARHSQPRG